MDNERLTNLIPTALMILFMRPLVSTPTGVAVAYAAEALNFGLKF
jgi:hypothetical protein